MDTPLEKQALPDQLERNVRGALDLLNQPIQALVDACEFGSRTTLYNLLAGKAVHQSSQERLVEGLSKLLERQFPGFGKLTWEELVSSGDVTARFNRRPFCSDPSESSFDTIANVEETASDLTNPLSGAIAALRKQADTAQQAGLISDYRARLVAIAIIQEQFAPSDDQLKVLRELINVEGRLGDRIARARALARAAWVAYRRSQGDDAMQYAKDAMTLIEGSGESSNTDVRTWLKALDCLAMVLAHKGQFREAIGRLERSLEKRMHLDCPLLRAATLYRMARVHEMAGNRDQATGFYIESFYLRLAHGAITEAIKVVQHLVPLSISQSRFEEIETAIEELQAKYSATRHRFEIARLKNELTLAQEKQ